VVGAGVWWVLFVLRPPASLGRVEPASVKPDAISSTADLPKPTEHPEPTDAELSHAELSLTSSDGKTVMEVQAKQAEKHGRRFSLKQGTISFRNGDSQQLVLTITDATYEIFPGDTPRVDTGPSPSGKATTASNDAYATIEGSMHGELVGTGQSFDAKLLRWDEKANVIQAEAVTYYSSRIQVNGQSMRIALPTGTVDFIGPVTSTIDADVGGKGATGGLLGK